MIEIMEFRGEEKTAFALYAITLLILNFTLLLLISFFNTFLDLFGTNLSDTDIILDTVSDEHIKILEGSSMILFILSVSIIRL